MKSNEVDIKAGSNRSGGLKPNLDGLIYLHDIHNDDLDKRNSFFTCAPFINSSWWNVEDWPSHIFFVSSFWSETTMSTEGMEKREAEIGKSYWSIGKVTMMRYGDSGQTAKEILESVVLQLKR
jgi:hypothetical protein